MTDKREAARGFPWRIAGWSIPVLLLAIPWIARFPWTLFDYVCMAAAFGIAGLLIELGVRASGIIAYRAATAIAVIAGFLLLWVNGAVGFLGDENNPANLMFGGVIAIAAIGAFLVQGRPSGLARAMTAAAIAQLLAGVTGYAAGWASPGADGVYEAVMGTGVFGALWLASAALFRKAHLQQRELALRAEWSGGGIAGRSVKK